MLNKQTSITKKIALEYYLFKLKNQWKRQEIHDELSSFNYHIKKDLTLKQLSTLKYHYTESHYDSLLKNIPYQETLKNYLKKF